MKTLTKQSFEKLQSRFSYLHSGLELHTEGKETFVITTSPITKGETVAVFGGKIIPKKEYSNEKYSSFHQISNDLVIVTPIHDDGADPIHLIRTSNSPNVGFKGQIELVALRNIAKGEEISFDAAMMSTSVLNPKDDAMEQLRKRYNGFFPEFIQSKINSDSNLRVFPAFQEGAWGLLTSIDLVNCNPDLIRSSDAIKQYVYELCDLIEMKRFGECNVVYFGEDDRVAGYSMFQLIETSCISAHFANDTNTAYIDIFSCKCYDPKVASEFTKNFFKGTDMRISVTNRL